MKTTKKKRNTEITDISPEEAMKQLQKIFKKRGTKALETARKEILKEKIECKEAKEALTYFITEYWHDLARPTLLSLACEAIGGDPELTIPIAVPMILISGAIDIHDDIIDQSEIKNGRPTVYGKFGKDIALLVGDALIFKGLTLFNKIAEEKISTKMMRHINALIQNTFFELGDAEAQELQFRGRLDITPEQYLQVMHKKAADVEAHTRISAIVGNASKEEIEALGNYGRLLGMLILLRDDWIDMIDFEELRQRLKKESIPLPLIYALQNSQVKPAIDSILSKESLTERDSVRILELTRKSGGIKHLKMLMYKLFEDTEKEVAKLKYNQIYLQLLTYAMLPSSSRESYR